MSETESPHSIMPLILSHFYPSFINQSWSHVAINNCQECGSWNYVNGQIKLFSNHVSEIWHLDSNWDIEMYDTKSRYVKKLMIVTMTTMMVMAVMTMMMMQGYQECRLPLWVSSGYLCLWFLPTEVAQHSSAMQPIQNNWMQRKHCQLALLNQHNEGKCNNAGKWKLR